MSAPINLSEKFPEMQPVKSAPTLSTINGCGFAMWGRRDEDPETGTYLKTHCFVLLFIPVFCWRAYRVADSPAGGWYFFGREPLSLFAKLWNLLFVTCVGVAIGVGAWTNHINSPEYIAARKMEEAQSEVDAGNWQKASQILHGVARASTTQAAPAFTKFREIIVKEVPTADLPVVMDSIRLGASLVSRGGSDFATQLIHDVAAPSINSLSNTVPAETLGLLPLLEPLIVQAKEPGDSRRWFDETKRSLLEAAFSSTPNPAIEIVIELASALEVEGNLDRCEEILTPRKSDLGTSEGARILGQVYAGRGELDNAYQLLMPYMELKLSRLATTNQQLDERAKTVQDQALQDLEQGRGPETFYARYDSAAEEQQQELVSQFIVERLQADAVIKQLQDEIAALGAAVPAAIDLGIIQLRRAQAETDPALRTKELEQSEKTFLAVRGQVGETDAYRLFLGQVYFWMGRQDEGKQLFEELLAKGRTPELLVEVARAYREVGSDADARLLAEESFQIASTDSQRDAAASMRAVMSIDVDDRLLWLEKCDTTTGYGKIQLATAKAEKAEWDGRDAEAIDFYQQVLDGYQQQPESATTLNNEALVLFRLSILKSDSASFDRGLEKLERAIALNPDNSIVLLNATDAIENAAIVSFVGNRLNFESTGVEKSLSVVTWLYNDEAGHRETAAALSHHPGIRRSIENYEKLTVISPGSELVWRSLGKIYLFLDDRKKLESFRDRLKTAPIDHTSEVIAIEKYRRGEMDDMVMTASKASEERFTKYLQSNSGPDDFESACVIQSMIEGHETMADAGAQIDDEADMKMALRVSEAIPSAAARSLLSATHWRVMLKRLSASSQAVAATAEKYKRDFNAETIVLIALREDPLLKESLLSQPEMARWIELMKENMRLFPNSALVLRYQMLKILGEEELANEQKTRLINGSGEALDIEVEVLLFPHNTGIALNGYWYFQLCGDRVRAEKCLEGISKELDLGPLLKDFDAAAN